jgi:hypothetical protein
MIELPEYIKALKPLNALINYNKTMHIIFNNIKRPERDARSRIRTHTPGVASLQMKKCPVGCPMIFSTYFF